MSTPTTEYRCEFCRDLPETCDACESSLVARYAGRRGNSLMTPSDTRSWTFEELVEVVLYKLNHQGYCVVDKFHKEEKALAILREVEGIHRDGLMHDGQLTSSVASANIRGDQIAWIDDRAQIERTHHIVSHMKRVDQLIRMLDAKLTYLKIQNRTQAMVACYPGGGKRYRKHVDNPHRDGRCITTLYYLNKDYNVSSSSLINSTSRFCAVGGWQVDGGVLRLYPGGGDEFIDIEPTLDRFLIFWSDRRNPHEVLPAYRTRYAITLWYFDHEERAQEKERLQRKYQRERMEQKKQEGVNKGYMF